MVTIVVNSSLGKRTCGTGNDESMLKREREGRGRERNTDINDCTFY